MPKKSKTQRCPNCGLPPDLCVCCKKCGLPLGLCGHPFWLDPQQYVDLKKDKLFKEPDKIKDPLKGRHFIGMIPTPSGDFIKGLVERENFTHHYRPKTPPRPFPDGLLDDILNYREGERIIFFNQLNVEKLIGYKAYVEYKPFAGEVVITLTGFSMDGARHLVESLIPIKKNEVHGK